MEKTIHLREGVSASWPSLAEEQIEVVATQATQKVDKRSGKHFSLQQGIGVEQQSDSNTNYTNWSSDQSISTKDNQHNMENNGSLGMRWNEATNLTVVK